MAEAKQQQKSKAEWVNDVVTPEGRAAFVHLKIPDAFEGKGEPKYKLRLLFEKETDFKAFKIETLRCARKKWGKNVKLGMIQVPWQDGDEQADKDGHEDCVLPVCWPRGTTRRAVATNEKPLRATPRRDSRMLEHETGLEPATPTVATCSGPWVLLRFPAKPPQGAALGTPA